LGSIAVGFVIWLLSLLMHSGQCFIAKILEACLGLALLPVIVQLLHQTLWTPAHHRRSDVFYQNPLLFVFRDSHDGLGFFPKDEWEVHGGQLYDFWQLKRGGHLSRECVKRHYSFESLQRAVSLIGKDIFPEHKIKISTHFLHDEKMAEYARTYGIEYTKKRASLGKVLIVLPGVAIDIFLKYRLTNGKWPGWKMFCRILIAPEYFIPATSLLNITNDVNHQKGRTDREQDAGDT